MPELTASDVLVGRIALASGKVTRPQLDLAIAVFNRGEAQNLASALVRSGFVSTPDMQALIAQARAQEQGNDLTASVRQRVQQGGPLTASVFQRGGAPPMPTPLANSQSTQMGLRPPANGGYAPLPQTDISGMQSVRVRADPNAARAPHVGTNAHELARRQYEEYVLGRLLVSRNMVSEPQIVELGRRQKLEETTSGQHVPLARALIRAGLVPPAVVDQLTADIRRKVFACAKCGDCYYVEPGPLPQRLSCRRCQGPVDVASVDGRTLPPVPADPATVADGETTQPVSVAGFGGPPPMGGPGPGGFGVPPVSNFGSPSAGTFVSPPGSFGGAPASGGFNPFGGAPSGSGFIAPPGGFGGAPTSPGFGAAPSGFGAGPAPAFGSSPTAGFGGAPGGDRASDQPESVGEWVIEKEIGRGGMGVIYLAKHKTRGEKAALKLMLNASQASEKKQKRFAREMDAARKLNHPNIVRLLDNGEHEGFPWFAMEFVEGKPLDKLLKEDLDLELGMEVLEKLCRAVHYAHEQGIIHRDLKPANVLVDDNMNPKLTDFGLAKSEDHQSVLTKTGAVVGTPYYLSPEQARGQSKDVDRRADIYALGVIMYETITGRLPFVGQTTVELYNRILNDDPPPPTRLKPQLTHETETVCLKALEKNPADRYQTAEELADDVKALLEARPIRARPPGIVRRLFKRLKKQGTGTVIAVSAALVLGSGGTVGGLLWYKHQKERTVRDGMAERDVFEKAFTDAAAVVSSSIIETEQFLEISKDREALRAASEAVGAAEKAEGAFASLKLEFNKVFLEQQKSARAGSLRQMRALSYAMRGRAFMAIDDPAGLEKATKDLEEAVKVDAELPEVVLAQAELLVLTVRIGDALEKLKSAAAYVPARLLEARIHRAVRDDPQEALKALREAATLLGAEAKDAQPGSYHGDWAVLRARVLAETALATLLSDVDEAETKALAPADEAIKVAPDAWEGWFARARALFAQGRRYEAREALLRAQDKGKACFTALVEAAQLWLEMRRYAEARAAADLAIRHNPAALDGFALRAEIRDANLESEARGDAEQVVARAGQNKRHWQAVARARRLLARWVLMTGDPGDVKSRAFEYANAARDADPEGSETRCLVAAVQLHPVFGAHNADACEKSLKEAQKRRGSNAEVKRAMARVYEAKNEGSLVKAKDRVQAAVRADPRSPWSHAVLARVYKSAGEDQADEEALRALDLERDVRRDEGYYYALALRIILGKGKQRDVAQNALRHAILVDPHHAQALVALGDHVWGTSDYPRGADFYWQACRANHAFGWALQTFAHKVCRQGVSKDDNYKRAKEAIEAAEKLYGVATAQTKVVTAWTRVRQIQTADPALGKKVEEIAAIFSEAVALDPWSEEVARERNDALGLSLIANAQAPEARAAVEATKKDWEVQHARLVSTRAEAKIRGDQAAQALARGDLDKALELAVKATRTMPSFSEAWVRLADVRTKRRETSGAIAAWARAAALEPTDLRPIVALATIARELRQTKRGLSAVDVALSQDDEAGPATPAQKQLVAACVRALAALAAPDLETSAEAKEHAKEAHALARKLVARHPEELVNPFVRGLAALADGALDDATRELGFCGVALDERGDFLFLHAVAAARASAKAALADAPPELKGQSAAFADEALEALEKAIAANGDFQNLAKNDPDLAAVAKRLK